MSVDRLAEVFLALLTLVVGYASFWLATRSGHYQHKAAIHAVDAEAYERAREIYEGALGTLRNDLTTTRNDLATTRNDLVNARGEIVTLRREILMLRHRIAELGGSADQEEEST